MSDREIAEICDRIVRERDSQARSSFFTKAILFSKFNPTPDTYFDIAKLVLVSQEYDLVVAAILDPDVYHALPLDLKAIVDMYFQWSVPDLNTRKDESWKCD